MESYYTQTFVIQHKRILFSTVFTPHTLNKATKLPDDPSTGVEN